MCIPLPCFLKQIEVSPEGIITDAKFKTFGCGSAIASSSVATEWVKGRSVEDVLSIKNTVCAEKSLVDVIECFTLFFLVNCVQDIANHLKLPPVKLHW
jgi:NifU-like protein involved in Fe-S cluster formation